MSCEAERLRAWCAERVPVTQALRDRACVAWLAQRAADAVPSGINGMLYKFADGSRLVLTSDAATVLR